jgi:hypothetical protein
LSNQCWSSSTAHGGKYGVKFRIIVWWSCVKQEGSSNKCVGRFLANTRLETHRHRTKTRVMRMSEMTTMPRTGLWMLLHVCRRWHWHVRARSCDIA